MTKTLGGQETIATPSQSAGTLTVDASAGNVHISGAINANITTWTISNVPASGVACTLTVSLLMGSTLRTVVDPPGTLHWLSPHPITYVVSKYMVFTLLTGDGGSNWFVQAAVEQ